jgi:hypothetical protein
MKRHLLHNHRRFHATSCFCHNANLFCPGEGKE